MNAIAELELSSRRSDLAPGPGSGATLEDETAENLVSDVKRYVLMGIDLCERFSKEMKMKSISRKGKVVTTLNDAEQMWLNLLEIAVVFSREVASTVSDLAANTDDDRARHTQIVDSLRVVVQDIFTSLLSLTSSTSKSPS